MVHKKSRTQSLMKNVTLKYCRLVPNKSSVIFLVNSVKVILDLVLFRNITSVCVCELSKKLINY